MKTAPIFLCFLQFIQISDCSTPGYGEGIVRDSDSVQFGSNSTRTNFNIGFAQRILDSENTPSELDSISIWVNFIKSNWNQSEMANSEPDTIDSVSSRDRKLSMVRSTLNSVHHNGNQGFSTDLQVRFKLQLELLLASAYYFSLSENSELGNSQKVVISRNFLKKLQGGEEIAVDPLTQEAADFALDYAGSHYFVLPLLEKYLLIDQISMSLSSSSVDDETKSNLSDRLGLDSTQVQDYSEYPDAPNFRTRTSFWLTNRACASFITWKMISSSSQFGVQKIFTTGWSMQSSTRILMKDSISGFFGVFL